MFYTTSVVQLVRMIIRYVYTTSVVQLVRMIIRYVYTTSVVQLVRMIIRYVLYHQRGAAGQNDHNGMFCLTAHV